MYVFRKGVPGSLILDWISWILSLTGANPMTGNEYVVYKQRWIILVGVLTCGFIRGYFPSMFAISNDVMTMYFRITPLQADMLTSADNAVAVIACFGTSIVGKKIGVRVLSLTTAISSALCSVAIGIAITARDLYALMLCGRLVSGVSAALMYLLPPILANAWFPSTQVATAAALPITAMCAGGIVSPMLFSNLLPKANSTAAFPNTTSNSSLEIEKLDRLQIVFITNMAVFLALSILSIAMFCICAPNHPPTPPSGAQTRLLEIEKDRKSELDVQQNFKNLIDILQLRSFWIIVAVTMTNASCMPFTLYLQPSLLKATFESASNSIAGYCMIITTVSSASGSVVAGKVLDKWHRYKTFCFMGLLSGSGCCVAIYFSHVYRNIWIFVTFQSFAGFLRLFNYVCIVELLLEVTYPRDRTMATCLFFAFYNLSTFLWTPLERWVMARFGEQYVSLVVVISQTISALILLISKIGYKRTLANRSKVATGKGTKFGRKFMSAET